jgi:hypothetical protein
MDVDDEDSNEDDEMDVDDEARPSSKKVKTNSGGVVAKRMPRFDRTLAGMRDEAVCVINSIHRQGTHLLCDFLASRSGYKATQPRSTAS